ncbi:MAG: hypothetical protein ACLU6Y_16110 [Ruminococcus sp.]
MGAQQAIMQEEEAAQPATEQAEPQLTARIPGGFRQRHRKRTHCH